MIIGGFRKVGRGWQLPALLCNNKQGKKMNDSTKVLVQFLENKGWDGNEIMRGLSGDHIPPQRILPVPAKSMLKDVSPKSMPGQTKKAATVAIPGELYEGWDKLDKADKLEGIKDNNYNLFAALYSDKFGIFPNGFADKIDTTILGTYLHALKDGVQCSMPALADAAKKQAFPKELYEGWDKLDKADKLEVLKANNLTLYTVLYMDKYGKYPTGAVDKIDHSAKELYRQELNRHKVSEMRKMTYDELEQKNLIQELHRLDAGCYREKYLQKFGKNSLI